jgi:hypothetical protein
MSGPGYVQSVQDGHIMRVKYILIPLCILIMVALLIPANAAADDAQVNVTSTDTIAPAETIIPAITPTFDPLGTLAVVVGIRKDKPEEKAGNTNLTIAIRDNRKDSPSNWWDGFSFFRIFFGNQTQVRNVPGLNITNQTKSDNLRPHPQKDQADLRKNAGNTSISMDNNTHASRSEIIPDQINRSVNHQDTRDLRNRTQENRTPLNGRPHEDFRIDRTNTTSTPAIPQNDMNIRIDRQQISNESGNQSSFS